MVLRLKLDENIPVEAAPLLASAGHDCHTVYDEALGGTNDAQLIGRCRADNRVLVTLDLDFADVRAYPPAEHAGIIVLRPRGPYRESILRLVARAIPLLGVEAVEGRLWVVEEERIRIRGGGVPPA